MAKAKKQNNTLVSIDLVGIALSIWFTNSVINNAQDMIIYGVKNAPASYAFIAAVAVVGLTTYKNEGKITQLSLITLSVLATSGVIWLTGL